MCVSVRVFAALVDGSSLQSFVRHHSATDRGAGGNRAGAALVRQGRIRAELMEALYAASAFATPLHLYVFESEETTPDAESTAHLALYAASAFVIYKLITRNLLLASWLNPPAAGGSHFAEAAATAAERRAASRSPSPHHRLPTMESSNADASAAPCAPKPPTTRPPSRLQLNTGPKQPHPPPTPKARSQHHRTPAAVTAPACDWTKGWGDFGLEHLSEPERKRKRERAQENDGGAKRRES